MMVLMFWATPTKAKQQLAHDQNCWNWVWWILLILKWFLLRQGLCLQPLTVSCCLRNSLVHQYSDTDCPESSQNLVDLKEKSRDSDIADAGWWFNTTSWQQVELNPLLQKDNSFEARIDSNVLAIRLPPNKWYVQSTCPRKVCGWSPKDWM